MTYLAIFATEFLNITHSFNLGQHVCDSSYNQGHTLDLVFNLGLTINALSLIDLPSDHKHSYLTPAFRQLL